MDYTPGQKFRLKEHVGYRPDYDPDKTYTVEGVSVQERQLERHDPIFADQVGVVLAWDGSQNPEMEATIPAEVNGAGSDEEDSVVLQFDHHDFIEHGDEESGPVHRQGVGASAKKRNVSFTEQQMKDWFEEVIE